MTTHPESSPRSQAGTPAQVRVQAPAQVPVHVPAGLQRRLRAAALAGTLLALAAGVLWTASPETGPFVGPTAVLLGTWLPVRWLGVPLLAAAALGVAVLTLGERLPRAVLGAVAVLQSAVLLVAYQGYGTMPAFGYGLALGIPAILLGIVSMTLVRMPRWRLPILATTGAAAVAGAWSGILTWSNLTHTIATVLGKVVTNQFVYAAILSVVLGLAWAAIAITTYPSAVTRATDWVTRHRRAWTIGAVICALPYGILRLAWLTPWQFENLLPGLPHVELDASTRLWGLCLGAACLLGAVLTSGLISRWGEVFPRWIPGLAGRTVPIAVAAVPGFTIATALLAGAPMMAVQFWDDWRTGLVTLVVFPFLPWGILLTLAMWGYVGHRLAADEGPASTRQPTEGDQDGQRTGGRAVRQGRPSARVRRTSRATAHRRRIAAHRQVIGGAERQGDREQFGSGRFEQTRRP